jgi:lambda family phage portal protein
MGTFLDLFRRAPKPVAASRSRVRSFAYDAATKPYWDGTTRGWQASGPNSSTISAIAPLRDRAQHLATNNPHARSAVDRLVDGTIGTGLTPRFGKWQGSAGRRFWADDHALNDLFAAWAEQCYVGSDLGWWGVQDPIVRCWRVRGETLIRRRWRRIEDGYPVPLQIEVLEGDHLDTGATTTPQQGGRVVAGVDFDGIGRRVGYWLSLAHPADSGYMGAGSAVVYVEARDLAHLYTMERPGQVRGVTHLAAIIEALSEIGEIRQAKRLKLWAEASIVAAKKLLEPEAPPPAEDDEGAQPPDDAPMSKVGPVAVVNLLEGEELTFAQQTASPDLVELLRGEEKRVAVGAGVTYELMSGDLSDANYSSLRASSASHNLARAKERENHLQPILDRVVQWFVEAGQLAGKIGPGQKEWIWSRPRIAGVDREQVEIDRVGLEMGTTSEIEIISARGDDWRKVLAERSQYQAEAARLGLTADEARQAATSPKV